MKADWDVKKLGEVIVSNVVGLTKSSSEQEPSGKYKYVKMNNITVDNCFDLTKYVRVDATTQEAEKYGLTRGDFLFNTRNSYELVGKTCVFNKEVDEVTLYNNNIMRIRFTKDVDSAFVNYLFSSEPVKKKLDKLKSGTTNVSAIYFKDLKNLEIYLPPLAEQQRIVAILDEAFAAIDRAKTNAEANQQNARALFESYLQSVFANPGEGWKSVKLSDLAVDITDGDHMPPPKSESGVPFITISNINKKTNEIDFSDTFTVSPDYYRSLKSNRKPKQDDVLYTVTGSFGIPVIVESNAEFCFQRHIGLIRPKSDVNSKWLFYLILSPQVFKQGNDGATGTAQRTVSLSVLRNFKVPKIPLAEQQAIVAKLDALSAETKKLEAIYRQKVADLDELKKAILQKAFRGELTKTQGELTSL